MPDLDGLLRRALPPVDPPDDLATRLRGTLQSIQELAAEELEAWERSAIRDPRRWPRPVAAAFAGALGAAALLVLGLRSRRARAD